MGFFLFLMYTAITLLRPADLWPELAPYRLAFTVGNSALGVSAVLLLASSRYKALVNKYAVLIVTLVLCLWMSLIVGERWIGGYAVIIQNFMVSLSFFLLSLWTLHSDRKIRFLCRFLAFMVFLIAIQGLLAIHFGMNSELFVFKQPLAYIPGQAERPTVDRMAGLGFMNDPNDLCLVLVMALPLLFLNWKPGQLPRNFLVVIVPALLFVYSIFLTRSRGGLLALAAVTFLGFSAGRASGRLRGAVIAALMVAVMAAGGMSGGREMSSSDGSAKGRLDAWGDGLRMFRSSPLFGVGYGRFAEHHERTAHNSFVLTMAELGFVGYVTWLMLLATAWFELQKLGEMREVIGERNATMARLLRLSFAGFLVGSFFLSRSYFPLLYLWLGMAAALAQFARHQEGGELLPPLKQVATVSVTGATASIVFVYLLLFVVR